MLQNRESQFVNQGQYEEAIAIAKQLHEIDPTGNHLLRAGFYKREDSNESYFLNSFNKNPSNSTNFVQTIYILGRKGRTNDILKAIDVFFKTAGDDAKKLTLIKNSYGLIGHWKEKEVIDERLVKIQPDQYAAWFDLAKTRILLGKTNEALSNLAKALKMHNSSETNAIDIHKSVMTNDLFKPFLEHPEIKPLIKVDLK